MYALRFPELCAQLGCAIGMMSWLLSRIYKNSNEEKARQLGRQYYPKSKRLQYVFIAVGGSLVLGFHLALLGG